MYKFEKNGPGPCLGLRRCINTLRAEEEIAWRCADTKEEKPRALGVETAAIWALHCDSCRLIVGCVWGGGRRNGGWLVVTREAAGDQWGTGGPSLRRMLISSPVLTSYFALYLDI